MALIVGNGNTLTCLQVFQGVARKLAVAFKFCGVIKHVATLANVGNAFIQQRFYHGNDVVNMLGHPWFVDVFIIRTAQHVQGLHVLMVNLNEFLW